MHSNCLEFACANVEHLNYTKMVLETWRLSHLEVQKQLFLLSGCI